VRTRIRLWGKKRGSRMSGWWVVGSVSEAAFYGSLFLLGIVSLTTAVTWQVFWPETSLVKVGFGFWLLVIACSSMVVIGLSGFVFKVSGTLASPERRGALVNQVKRGHQRRAEGIGPEKIEHLPDLQAYTDSPGVKLAYRLASQSGERAPLLLSMMFAASWNSMVSVLFAVSALNLASGQPNWFQIVLLVPFGIVSFFATRWFFQIFRKHSGIGPSAVEISDLPLLPGEVYKVYLCQYGRVVFDQLTVKLCGYEEATYQQGTDIRTEQAEIASYAAEPMEVSSNDAQGGLVADPEHPLEMLCQIRIPFDIMHSFHGANNSVRWKLVVTGEIKKWPTFCRSFPVVVYPRDAQ
jgi:hypothetical protein